MGIKSLQVTPDGGMFPLVSKGGEEEDKPVIQLHVPQGAVGAAGKGMVEAVLPDTHSPIGLVLQTTQSSQAKPQTIQYSVM